MFQIYAATLTVIFLVLLSSINILREYERGVVFFLGRFYRVKGPGLILIIPILQTMERVALRTVVLDVPSQDVISRDNVTVRVNAVVYFRVHDPEKAIMQVENYFQATSQLAQTTLRSILGENELDEMLSQREQLNGKIQQILDQNTDPWGIKVSHVEIKDIDLNETMIRAIAKQAEAERERRARVINSEGELQAATQLKQAADILGENEQGLSLRYLHTLSDIASDKSTTIVFPFPIDLIQKFIQSQSKS